MFSGTGPVPCTCLQVEMRRFQRAGRALTYRIRFDHLSFTSSSQGGGANLRQELLQARMTGRVEEQKGVVGLRCEGKTGIEGGWKQNWSAP